MKDMEERIQDYHVFLYSAQTMIDDEGEVYAADCRGCGRTVRHWNDETGMWVCAWGKCGKTWPSTTEKICKHEIQKSPRPSLYEENASRMAHFGYHFTKIQRDPQWEIAVRCLMGHALTSTTYREIAEHANEYGWPPGEWTEAKTRGWAEKAAEELGRRLRG